MKSKIHKKTHKKTKKKIHKKNTRRHLYRKRREIVSLPGSKGIPVFSATDIKKSNKIHIVTSNNISGNMIPGLRNM
jgi:hypothetical protein